jgi:hypothetical protein
MKYQVLDSVSPILLSINRQLVISLLKMRFFANVLLGAGLWSVAQACSSGQYQCSGCKWVDADNDGANDWYVCPLIVSIPQTTTKPSRCLPWRC